MPRYLFVAPVLWWLFHGLTWFAWPIIIMLILSPFLDIQHLTPLVALLGVLLNLFLILYHKKIVQRATIRPLIIPSLLWVLLGYLLLQSVDSFRAKKIIAVSILVFLWVNYLLKKKQWLFPSWTAPVLAWLWGIFGFAYNVNGPQLAARLMTKKVDKDTSVYISTSYFFIFGIVFVATHGWWWAYTMSFDRQQLLIMLAFLLLGSWCGDLLHKRLGAHQYNQLLQFFLLMSALIFLV